MSVACRVRSTHQNDGLNTAENVKNTKNIGYPDMVRKTHPTRVKRPYTASFINKYR